MMKIVVRETEARKASGHRWHRSLVAQVRTLSNKKKYFFFLFVFLLFINIILLSLFVVFVLNIAINIVFSHITAVSHHKTVFFLLLSILP